LIKKEAFSIGFFVPFSKIFPKTLKLLSEFANKLNEIKKMNKKIPVIIITAVTRDTGMEFVLDSKEEKSWIKADEIIQKCIRPEQLIGIIKKYLEV